MSNLQFVSSILQSFPSFKGKRRLSRIFINAVGIGRLKNINIATGAGKFQLPNLKEIISFDLFINGGYEKGLVKYLCKSIPKNGVFIDVGANIGSITIPIALHRPDIKIIAIEASPWIYGVLQHNISLNKIRNISVENYAVYSESGKEISIYAPKDLFGKGSLNPIFTKDAELVRNITIDDLLLKHNISKVDYIKVDVEGFEAFVFKGMKGTIRRDKPKLVFEFSEWAELAAGCEAGEAQNIILGYGYCVQMFDQKFRLVGYPSSKRIEGNDINLLAFNFEEE